MPGPMRHVQITCLAASGNFEVCFDVVDLIAAIARVINL